MFDTRMIGSYRLAHAEHRRWSLLTTCMFERCHLERGTSKSVCIVESIDDFWQWLEYDYCFRCRTSQKSCLNSSQHRTHAHPNPTSSTYPYIVANERQAFSKDVKISSMSYTFKRWWCHTYSATHWISRRKLAVIRFYHRKNVYT
jgi:hypothetical protein